MIKKILIANRGEIALRILRAAREMNIETVAVHSTADADAMHVRLSDESVCIGPAPSKQSYLNVAAILSAAEITGADAIHPGVGFLSENATFARIVEEHGLIFIGPKADHIALMGDKIQAKKTAAEIGLPLTPGSDGALTSFEHAEKTTKEIGYPVLIKAASGGGGKGMKVAKNPSDLEEAYAMARIEANANFGNDVVYMERYLAAPRHIEVQVIGDHYGNVVQLGERDCSIQRRHQKIWEEAPSSALTPEAREKLGDLVQKAIKKMGYFSAGTLEFLFEEGSFYFIEMNTRLQVEHPITEMITGIDLMQEQIRVAAGLPLSFTQEDVSWSGHAIECRINAENPETFLPSPGTVTAYLPPGGFRVRVDSPLYAGYKIPPYYDSLIAKLIVHGSDRSDCLKRLRRALQEYVIVGPETLLPLHRRLSLEPAIEKGEYTIHWLENFLHSSQQSPTE
ncbi:MAG: acetyl-CoA carboxylase biotin carboxylase subunit [Holosporales bacterium]|nr:acetyl-CoA carboxylase biotin carboxylase subunit [Holosporales bacterium]